MPIMPGADTSRMLSGYTKRMSAYRGVVDHVAVSEAPFPSYAPGSAAHFYIRKDGGIVQQIDTAYRGGHSYEGNATLIGKETQGGVYDANNEPWTEAQCESSAKINAWLHQTHGIPLQMMPNSLASSTGFGYHRQGIDGNFGPYAYKGRVPGGQRWSRSFGKICPGDAKIAQIPGIIARAAVLAGTTVVVTNPVPAPIPTAPTAGGLTMATFPTLNLNTTSSNQWNPMVERVQALIKYGCDIDPGPIDGHNGPATKRGAAAMQVKYNCGNGRGGADLVLGPKSWESMLLGKKH